MTAPAQWLRFADVWLARSARRTLAERFGSHEAARIVRSAVRASRAPAARPPVEPTVGGRLMVHAAALTAALYQQLVAAGVEAAEARRETARVTWDVYRRMGRVPWLVARLGGRGLEGRLRRAIAVFRRFPFGPPAYHMRDLRVAPGVVAFDVERCPVAEYFGKRGLGPVCVEAWCNLDYPLARAWGARLERDTTIAGGASRCDFRWHVAAARAPEE